MSADSNTTQLEINRITFILKLTQKGPKSGPIRAKFQALQVFV
jgi:hypothetical protein